MDVSSLPACWQTALAADLDSDWFAELSEFVSAERQRSEVFPEEADVFTALQLTPLDRVKVVILGQDPYHDTGQAHGLSFSVRPGVKIPPSLRNIYRELREDLGVATPEHGFLEAWAKQGVLMLNTVLTVRAHEANSHRRRGWERFTDSVISTVAERRSAVFILWGRPAQKKKPLITGNQLILESAHPSPLSARTGFFDSKPFSKANAWLKANGQQVVNWELPAEAGGNEGWLFPV